MGFQSAVGEIVDKPETMLITLSCSICIIPSADSVNLIIRYWNPGEKLLLQFSNIIFMSEIESTKHQAQNNL
jgi:hypothetical protein